MSECKLMSLKDSSSSSSSSSSTAPSCSSEQARCSPIAANTAGAFNFKAASSNNHRLKQAEDSLRTVMGEEDSHRRSFLSLEEAGLVEISGLSTHERFLCRLTISSLNLLRVVSEQEGCSIEELNAGKVCDWFVKDKLKREQDIDSAVLQWDESEFPV
ncbi:hypothetical protein GQ457_05G029640 [Hibiscus cannabinus]